MGKKHTPGPWTVDTTLITGRGIKIPISSDHWEVCTIETDDTDDNAAADARLIAAAPDLYEACEAIEVLSISDEWATPEHITVAVEAVLKALKKARGE